MRLSIVINTYNREAYLRRLLATLDHLTGCELEVIVVNGPSTDGTAPLLEEWKRRIKVIDCPTRNLSHSRNLGIAAATGEVVAFIDDDALPVDAEWGARYVDLFARDAEGRVGAAGGPVWHHDTPWKEFEAGLTSDYGFQVFDISKGRPTRGRWWPRIQGCNCAFRRRALVDVGGFDEFFTYYHDETDLCLRLARAGFETKHLPGNGVRHYAAPSERRTSKYDRNWYVVTRSDTYFALKNGGDALPARALRTLTSAPRKHYVREINSYLVHGEISPLHWMKLLGQWASGFASGARAGLRSERQLARFEQPVRPFVPFRGRRRSRPLTVALLTQTIPGQPHYGGVGRYTYDLAKGLHERGHQVHIVCRSECARVHRSPGFAIHGITNTALAKQRTQVDLPVTGKNLRYALAVAEQLRELDAQGESIDVVHATNWDAESVAVIRSQAYPVVLTLVSSLAQVIHAEGWPLTEDLRCALALDRWQISSADHVVVPSRGVLDTYRAQCDIDPGALPHLTVVPLGIVPDTQPLPEPLPEPLGDARHRLLFVGRMEHRKGIHTLLEALPGLLAPREDWECHLVGDDQVTDLHGQTHKERFLSEHRGAGWLERVCFHGAVSEAELREHYRRCDLFVAPSLYESFGLIFHEAMQYGKPVVGCRAGGVPETVQDGQEGMLVAPGDAQQLGDALATLMGDQALRRALGEAGRRRVFTCQNVATMTDAYSSVYESVMARVGSTRATHRKSLWPTPISLMANGRVERSGAWEVRQAFLGTEYLVSEEPGAALTVKVPAGSLIELTALRHPWSGVVTLEADGSPLGLVNLYKAGEMDPAFIARARAPQTATGEVTVRLVVQREKHPASFARQIWLRQLVCRTPVAPEASAQEASGTGRDHVVTVSHLAAISARSRGASA